MSSTWISLKSRLWRERYLEVYTGPAGAVIRIFDGPLIGEASLKFAIGGVDLERLISALEGLREVHESHPNASS